MIAAIIPRYVSNRALAKGYRLLAIFGVPRFIRKNHLRENRIRLEQAGWDFWNDKDALIENQREWGNIRFGVGRRLSMKYAGCEVIATYNARKALGVPSSRKMMAELIEIYEARGAALWGVFGVAPTMIAAYFRKNGFAVETADGADEAAVERIAESHQVMIATAYNDKNDIMAQIHTVCITKSRDGNFVLHNAYHRDDKGRFRESRPYVTIQEAVSHISRREPKLIYLIGIQREVGENFSVKSDGFCYNVKNDWRYAMSKQQMIANLISTAPESKLDIILSFVEFVLKESTDMDNMLLSEPSLSVDWMLEEENAAWKDL